MSTPRALRTAALCLGLAAISKTAAAQDPLPDAVRAEAHDRFDRAVRLFGEKDNDAALAEFRRVYELAPNPAVLFNIGLVYAALGRAVEAVDALDRVLEAPGTVPPIGWPSRAHYGPNRRRMSGLSLLAFLSTSRR